VKQYRIRINGKNRYFVTLDAANLAASMIFDATGIVVGIEAVPSEEEKRAKRNAARRAKHAAYTSCGMKRVRGALGGVYYE
jgi:hypothetical protein